MVLARGVSVNARDKWGQTVLLAAAGDYVNNTDAAACPDPDDPGQPQPPVLPGMIGYLLAHGADVSDADKYGRTALAWAAAKGQTDTAQALLDAGADPAGRDVKGHTAPYWARRGTWDGNGWGQPLGARGRLLRLLQRPQ